MRGIKGLRKCPPEDLVWGTLGYPAIKPTEGITAKRYDSAVRVRVKVTPYAADFAAISRGEAPPWSKGSSWVFPRSIRNTAQPASDSRNKFCMGSRAVYRGDKQIAVNYLYVGDPVLGGSGLVYWNQLNLETGVMDQRVLVLPDEEGSQGYDSTLDTHTRGNACEGEFYNPFLPYFYGYDPPDTPLLQGYWGTMFCFKSTNLTVANSIPPYKSRVGGWSAGLRYLSLSGYVNSDSINEGSRFGIVRYDASIGNAFDAWYGITSTVWDPAIRFALVRPAIRSYIRDGVDNDEPWWCAYDRATNRIGTGRWRARNGESLAAEVEHVYELPPGAGLGPNILCYNRVAGGRDLFVVRDAATIFPGGAGGVRSGLHWLFDGEAWIPIGGGPSFVTADHDGNLLYGNKRLIAKLGAGAWSHVGTGEYGPVAGGPILPEQPLDDPGESPPAYNSPYEDFFFQILVSKSWIHARDFFGQRDLATSPLTSAEWPDYVIADRANSRDEQAVYSDLWKCWSLSHDGAIRVPHVQFHAPYANGDPRRRIQPRMYAGLNPSEYQMITTFGDAYPWPKYGHSNFQCDWSHGMDQFLPWLPNYGNAGTGVENDTFISHAYNYDFDIVETCQCCCPSAAVSY